MRNPGHFHGFRRDFEALFLDILIVFSIFSEFSDGDFWFGYKLLVFLVLIITRRRFFRVFRVVSEIL